MRRSPPVRVQLQPQPGVQALVALIISLAAAGLAAWVTSHQSWCWPVWSGVPLLAWLAWRQAAVRPRLLRWDGQAWWLSEPGAAAETAVEIAVLMDLDGWLLLHARPGPRWLPLSRRQQGPQWSALRATLFAARGGGTDR